jgi:hypothetical protein
MTNYLTSHQLNFLKTKKREAQHPQPQLIPVREETQRTAPGPVPLCRAWSTTLARFHKAAYTPSTTPALAS